jgi:hypothetical protein
VSAEIPLDLPGQLLTLMEMVKISECQLEKLATGVL